MEILEFGNKENKKIVLIHGFQSPYQVWNKYIENYKKDFHIIVPILPGHNPNLKEDFISFEDTAKEIEDYYISRYGNNLYAIFGMSMCGVLAATIWQNKRLNIEKVIFDGSALVFNNKFMKGIMINFYLKVTHKTQQRDKEAYESAVKLVPNDYVDDLINLIDNMSDATIINCVNGIGDFKLSKNINTPNTKIYFFHGTKKNEKLAMKSAKFLLKNYPNAYIKCFEGKGHCENSIFYPEVMIEEINRVLQ